MFSGFCLLWCLFLCHDLRSLFVFLLSLLWSFGCVVELWLFSILSFLFRWLKFIWNDSLGLFIYAVVFSLCHVCFTSPLLFGITAWLLSIYELVARFRFV